MKNINKYNIGDIVYRVYLRKECSVGKRYHYYYVTDYKYTVTGFSIKTYDKDFNIVFIYYDVVEENCDANNTISTHESDLFKSYKKAASECEKLNKELLKNN